jgi:hypothetical protein
MNTDTLQYHIMGKAGHFLNAYGKFVGKVSHILHLSIASGGGACADLWATVAILVVRKK